jgi:hypothetical protein
LAESQALYLRNGQLYLVNDEPRPGSETSKLDGRNGSFWERWEERAKGWLATSQSAKK